VRRISYGQTVIGTDDRVGDLLLQYATVLARAGSADTVVIPSRIGTGGVAPVSMLIGPASEITSWTDDEPFDADASEAIADLEQRIARRLGGGGSDAGPGPGPGAIDEFDDLA
jgi:hypothetical protein